MNVACLFVTPKMPTYSAARVDWIWEAVAVEIYIPAMQILCTGLCTKPKEAPQSLAGPHLLAERENLDFNRLLVAVSSAVKL